jgi:hypothetical protein
MNIILTGDKAIDNNFRFKVESVFKASCGKPTFNATGWIKFTASPMGLKITLPRRLEISH